MDDLQAALLNDAARDVRELRRDFLDLLKMIRDARDLESLQVDVGSHDWRSAR